MTLKIFSRLVMQVTSLAEGQPTHSQNLMCISDSGLNKGERQGNRKIEYQKADIISKMPMIVLQEQWRQTKELLIGHLTVMMVNYNPS